MPSPPQQPHPDAPLARSTSCLHCWLATWVCTRGRTHRCGGPPERSPCSGCAGSASRDAHIAQCRGPETGCDLQGRISMLKAAVKSPGRWDILLQLALSTSHTRRFSLSSAIDLLSLKETRQKEQTKMDPPSSSPGEQIWL